MRRNIFFYLTSVFILCLLGWMKLQGAGGILKRFVPPGESERREAVGSTRGISTHLQAAFDPMDDSFSPIPTPGRSDWLANISETGQTFSEYQRSRPNRPDQNRTTIYLQPLGAFPPGVAPSLNKLADFACAFFAMPVKQLPEVSIQGLPIESRPRERMRQVLTGDILRWLKHRVPEDAYCLLAVTMTDLYPDPKWNFVFGQGSLKDRVGVYSFARFLPPNEGTSVSKSAESLLLLRSCKLLAHETGHIFGIKHCVHYHCLMNGSNGLSETDAAPIHLCPVCLRKLHFAKQYEVEQRYRKLRALSQQFGWESEENWLSRRLQSLAHGGN